MSALLLAVLGLVIGLLSIRQINEAAEWILGYFKRNPFTGIYRTCWEYVDELSGTRSVVVDFLELTQRGNTVKGGVFYSGVRKNYKISGRIEHRAIYGEWTNAEKDYRGFFLWRNKSYTAIDGAWIGPTRDDKMQGGTWHLERMEQQPTHITEYFFDRKLQRKALLGLVSALEGARNDANPVSVGSLQLTLVEGIFNPGSGRVSLELLELLKTEQAEVALDLGTGSGLYALFLASRGIRTIGVDVSAAAISCAQSNARLNQIEAKFLRSDLFKEVRDKKFDLVCANLPFTRKEFCAPIKGSKYYPSFACNEDLLKRFIFEVPDHLTDHGSVLFAFGSSGDLDLLHPCCQLAGLEITAQKVIEEKDLGETFLIFRGTRKTQ